MNDQRRGPNYKIYKPLKKADSGAALQFNYAADIQALFIEAARQKGDKLPVGDKNQFDWENKIMFKLGLVDIGQILLVLSGKKATVDLIHKSERDGVERTATLKLTKQKKDAGGGGFDNYALRLSKMETKDGQRADPVNVGLYIDHHEMVLIGILLRKASEKMMGIG